ncbi:MAG: YqiA/YcfP family alpha/beta fold hydrolase [Massilia sp.]
MILYLHGFRSSPQSFKARVVGEAMRARGLADALRCPQLPASPKAAMDLALALVDGCAPDQLAIVGSSLGGYYATWLAERLGCRAVLLNPAVAPFKDLANYVGVTSNWHSGQPFEFKEAYLAELDALAVPAISGPSRYFLIAATGDEVLDYRTMLAHYAGARQHVIDGSDHAISEFPAYVDEVLDVCLTGQAR